MNRDSLNIIPRWMPLKDAGLYAHIGKSRLISLAQEGKVKGFHDPDSKRQDWIFDRLSLDAYREAQYTAPAIQKKALAIMRSIQL